MCLIKGRDGSHLIDFLIKWKVLRQSPNTTTRANRLFGLEAEIVQRALVYKRFCWSFDALLGKSGRKIGVCLKENKLGRRSRGRGDLLRGASSRSFLCLAARTGERLHSYWISIHVNSLDHMMGPATLNHLCDKTIFFLISHLISGFLCYERLNRRCRKC